MNRLTKRNEKGIAYLAIADSLSKRDQELEGSKPILEGLYAMFQKLAEYEDLEEQITNIYIELKNKIHFDGVENYTTGYKYGHRNGQIELLEWILKIDTGCREEAEKALKERI